MSVGSAISAGARAPAKPKLKRPSSSGPSESRTAAAVGKSGADRERKLTGRAARQRRALRNINSALGSSYGSLIEAKAKTGAAQRRAHKAVPRKQSALEAGLNLGATVGALRAIGGTAIGIGDALNPAHPKRLLNTLGHSAGQVKDMAIGVGGLAALAGNTALLPVHEVTSGFSSKPAKELGAAYKQVGTGLAKHVSKDFGPLFRGEQGAQRKRNQQLRHEGVANAVADLSVVGGGESAILGSAARKAAAAGKGGALTARVAKATTERAPLRTGAQAVKQQKVSTGAVGGVARATLDKARTAKQTRRVREAETGQTGKTRAALKKPARQLPPHRAALEPGEVAPLSDTAARIAQARRTGASAADAAARASTLSKRLIVGAKGAKDGPTAGVTLRNATRGLSDEQAAAVGYANRLGVRDAKAGKAAVDLRIAQITREVDELRAKGAIKGAGHEPHVLQELPALRALSAKPELFDDPAVLAGAQAMHDVGGAVAKGHGLSADGARAVNAQLQAQHIGAEPIRLAQPSRVHVDAAALAAAKDAVKSASADVARAERAHGAARGALERARGRAEVGSRNVGGVAAERQAGRPVAAAQFAAGGHGVREASAALVKSAGELEAARGALKGAELAAAHHARGVKVPAQPGETAGEFADRIEALAMAEHGLHPAGYAPSRFNTADDKAGAEPATHGLGSKHRKGEVFATGSEITGHEAIRTTEKAHQTRLLRYERAGAVSDILEREGRAFANTAEAESFARTQRLGPGSYAIVGGETHGGTVRSSARTANLHTVGAATRGKDLGADFAPTGAVYIIPKQVKDSLDSLAKPPNAGGRALDKIKTVTGVSLLGLNPSWIQFQTIADGLVATAAGVTPADIARAYKIRKGWTDAQRDTLALLSGNGGVSDILGSSDALTGAAAILHANTVYRKFLEGKRPLTALIRADAARTGLVRDAAVMESIAKAQRTADIDAHIRAVRPLQDKLTSALASADPAKLAEALKGPAAEQAAAHVAQIMGDFTHYTALERRYLRRVIPFYGFLRYSTRLAFYTLPVDHPMVGLLLGEIGNASAEEQRAILGGDAPPYLLSAIYNADGTRKMDFSRASPLGNTLFGSGSIGSLGSGFLPPVAVPIMDVLAGNSLFRGNKSYTFNGGKPVDPSKLTAQQRLSIFTSELLGLIPPVRIAGKIAHPGAQSTGDDYGIFGSSRMPFDAPPSSALQRARDQLLPLATSSMPTEDKAKAERYRAAKLNKPASRGSKPRGGAGGDMFGGGGSSGGSDMFSGGGLP